MAATNLDRSLVRHWPSGGLLKQSSSGYAATFVGVPVILATNGALLSIVAAYSLLKSHGVREL
jgi:hypothetical protein